MTPKNSISLGRAFGIPIYLSKLLLLMVPLVMIMGPGSGSSPIMALLLFALLLGIVLLHELGHSLAAQHFGVKVSHITLWPLGGVAWMEGLPRDSRIECLVALAGPAVNLVLAAVATPLMLFGGPIAGFVSVFISINLLLGVFNLLPAFPMDGGRILRAYLARKGDWLAATERAVAVGKGFAFLLGAYGLLIGNLYMPFIAIFLWAMGKRELFTMRMREMGPGWPFAGFTGAAGQGQAGPWAAHDARAGQAAWAEAEPSAPRSPEAAPSEHKRGQGFSEADIERLESFHGRLKRDWREGL